MSKIYQGDCLKIMPKIPSNSIDLVLTDPPYGLDFMGKEWDKALPDKEIWAECLRVLKPGALAFVMSIPRSDCLSRMIISLEDAGFRVDFTPIYWTYASGFPKAQNIGKAVDKKSGVEREMVKRMRPDGKATGNAATGFMGGSESVSVTQGKAVSSQAKALDGSYGGFQPKPAVEVIIVAMKPMSEKTFVDQALKNQKGISWLDDCRIPTEESLSFGSRQLGDGNIYGKCKPTTEGIQNPQGRFPANLLVSDDVLNDGKDRKSPPDYRRNIHGEIGYHGKAYGQDSGNGYGDSGSFSRYFDLDKWANTLPFLIVSKASKGEKNKGLRDIKNIHPTVKPLKLMFYLITLGSRLGDTILDPFAGSGTTGVACQSLKRRFILIEKNKDYYEIMRNRLKGAKNKC